MAFAVHTFKFLLMVVVATVARAGPAPGQGLLPAMPAGCTDSHYCTEKHSAYPQQLVDDLLTQHHVSLGNRYKVGFADRDGSEADQDDCKKHVSYAPIYEIDDAEGKVRVVVQAANFTQQVRIEYCESPTRLKLEENTAHFTVEQMREHEIVCQDDAMAYNFLVLSADGRAFESLRAHPIPVSCSCRLREV